MSHHPTSRFVDVGELRLHVVDVGEGPAVVLLHGYPDFSYSWRRQIPALVAAGHRAIAPDLRGYALSDKPRRISAYRMENLVADVVGLLHACQIDRATVVGHDWGGVVAWNLAAQRPDLLSGVVVLNGPHPAAFARVLRHPRQLLRSWYMAFFQVPRAPEALLRARDFRALRTGLRRAATNPDAFTDEDIERYVAAFAHPGALRAATNYYRAAARRPGDSRRLARPRAAAAVPTLVIWGDRDTFLVPDLADPGRYAPGARVEHLPDAGHWVHLDAPERVNTLLLEFLAGR